jgi:hypothetical protein
MLPTPRSGAPLREALGEASWILEMASESGRGSSSVESEFFCIKPRRSSLVEFVVVLSRALRLSAGEGCADLYLARV